MRAGKNDTVGPHASLPAGAILAKADALALFALCEKNC
jgi:hypothetical protein